MRKEAETERDSSPHGGRKVGHSGSARESCLGAIFGRAARNPEWRIYRCLPVPIDCLHVRFEQFECGLSSAFATMPRRICEIFREIRKGLPSLECLKTCGCALQCFTFPPLMLAMVGNFERHDFVKNWKEFRAGLNKFVEPKLWHYESRTQDVDGEGESLILIVEILCHIVFFLRKLSARLSYCQL